MDDLNIRINGLGSHRQKAWQALRSEIRTGQIVQERADELLTEVVEQLHRALDSYAAALVDRDRGIREAMKRAEDCEHHGASIMFESHQAYAYSRLVEMYEAERTVYVHATFALQDALTAMPGDAAERVQSYLAQVERAGRKARQARDRIPSHADCQRAGQCEHPPPPPHGACQQLTLPLDEVA